MHIWVLCGVNMVENDAKRHYKRRKECVLTKCGQKKSTLDRALDGQT